MLLIILFNEQAYELCSCTAIGFSCTARVTTEYLYSNNFCLDLIVQEKAEVGLASHMLIWIQNAEVCAQFIYVFKHSATFNIFE